MGICIWVQSSMNRGLDPSSEPSLSALLKSSYPDNGVCCRKPLPGVCIGGDMLLGAGGVGPLVGCSGYCDGGPSTTGSPCFSSGMVIIPFFGLAGFSGCCCGELVPCGATMTPFSMATGCIPGGYATAPSGGTPIRAAFFDDRRVGRRVHRRFRPAHRLHGNFLSHFVFVLAQLLQAIGVRPADFGIMPLAAGIAS